MAQKNIEMTKEKTENMTERQKHNDDRTRRSLPIFFWTD
ncbi:hypothetical protein METP1_02892 [Methanosarcinales archaeon]|nr:hypothetical protein METP1_02892 [Methanosarcinales archaeon]